MLLDVELGPGQWVLGRIIELHPGKNGLTRVVSVRTRAGIQRRPVTKIAILPCEEHISPGEHHRETSSSVAVGKVQCK